MLLEQLGNLGFERGNGVTSITVGVLMVLRSYKDRKKLEALAKLSGMDEGFNDRVLHLEARRGLLPLLERAHEAGEGVTEEEVLLCPSGECKAYFKRAKEGFKRLLGECQGEGGGLSRCESHSIPYG